MDAFFQQAPMCCASIENIAQGNSPSPADASISQMALKARSGSRYGMTDPRAVIMLGPACRPRDIEVW